MVKNGHFQGKFGRKMVKSSHFKLSFGRLGGALIPTINFFASGGKNVYKKIASGGKKVIFSPHPAVKTSKKKKNRRWRHGVSSVA